MGAYINSGNMSKEDWLILHGVYFSYLFEWSSVKKEYLPVCLVNNGAFTAAGICYSEKEFIAFGRSDERPKKWFLVLISDLLKVSPELPGYLK